MHKPPVGASGTPSNWATWWILDGGDDAASLRAADAKGSLNQAVQVKPVLSPPPTPTTLQGEWWSFLRLQTWFGAGTCGDPHLLATWGIHPSAPHHDGRRQGHVGRQLPRGGNNGVLTGKGQASGKLLWLKRCWLCDGAAGDWGSRLKPIATFPSNASLDRPKEA